MNKITQITIKKREKNQHNQHLYFNSTQTQTKQKSGTELHCYICNFNNRCGVYLHKEEGIDETKQCRENMNILATWKNDIDQPHATERLKQCYGEFGVKYTTVLHDSV